MKKGYVPGKAKENLRIKTVVVLLQVLGQKGCCSWRFRGAHARNKIIHAFLSLRFSFPLVVWTYPAKLTLHMHASFFFVLPVRIATYNKEKTKENKRLSTSSSFSSVLSKGEKDLSLPSSLAKGQKGVKDSIVIEKRGKEKGAYSLAFSPISPVW